MSPDDVVIHGARPSTAIILISIVRTIPLSAMVKEGYPILLHETVKYVRKHNATQLKMVDNFLVKLRYSLYT